MGVFVNIICVAAVAIALASCAYKDLKAPCAPDEGRRAPLAYAEPPSPTHPFEEADACGPMTPVNKGKVDKDGFDKGRITESKFDGGM